MHDTFGKRAVQDILMSKEESFGKALQGTLKTDLQGFAKAWRHWVENRLHRPGPEKDVK
jgi:hypothetical protein